MDAGTLIAQTTWIALLCPIVQILAGSGILSVAFCGGE
jgi:hypothetical protein